MKIKVLNTHANENIKYYFPLLKKRLVSGQKNHQAQRLQEWIGWGFHK